MRQHTKKAFILPLAMLLVTIIVIVSFGISYILSKEIYFSRLQRDSTYAFAVADMAHECAVFIDDTYIDQSGLGTGQGIFPYSIDTEDLTQVLDNVNQGRERRGLTSISLADIKCASVPVLTTEFANFQTSRINKNVDGNLEAGIKSQFEMRVPESTGRFRCAKVTVTKTPNYRQIIAQGYSTCDTNKNRLERAVISETK